MQQQSGNYDRVQAVRCKPSSESSFLELLDRMDRAQPLNIGTWRIRGEGTAVQALAWHADCQQPVHIALLVDRTLRLGARGAGGSPVWVMSMVRAPCTGFAVLLGMPLSEVQSPPNRLAMMMPQSRMPVHACS